MKKRIITRECDRCGFTVAESNGAFKVLTLNRHKYDLCLSCVDSFKKWMTAKTRTVETLEGLSNKQTKILDRVVETARSFNEPS